MADRLGPLRRREMDVLATAAAELRGVEELYLADNAALGARRVAEVRRWRFSRRS